MEVKKFIGSKYDDVININNMSVCNYFDGGIGDDVYILSPKLKKDITILDTKGNNKINIPDDITISAAVFTDNGVMLTLDTGSNVTILGKTFDNIGFVTGNVDQDVDISESFLNTKEYSFAEYASKFGVDVKDLENEPVAATKIPEKQLANSDIMNINSRTTPTSYDANNGNMKFKVSSGDYEFAISNFHPGNTLSFQSNRLPTIDNDDLNDGTVVIESVYERRVVDIKLTGLSPEDDAAIISLASFKNVFGANSLSLF